MIDRLDKQILEIIDNATSIVRSISEREIQDGVLFPSVTTMDIKRNLSSSVTVEIIEGRLKALENESYIYFVENRWWLTNKGRSILGKSSEKTFHSINSSKPMREILEETFSKFETPKEEVLNTVNLQKDYTKIINKVKFIEALLLKLKQGFETSILSETEYFKIEASLKNKLKECNSQLDVFFKDKRGQLIKEIIELEHLLVKKKTALENMSKIQLNE